MSKERGGEILSALKLAKEQLHRASGYINIPSEVFVKLKKAIVEEQTKNAHYQPLLAAKEAEVAKLQEEADYVKFMEGVEAKLRNENTTLKALLEQARGALKYHKAHGNCDLADDHQTFVMLRDAAINAATGKGE